MKFIPAIALRVYDDPEIQKTTTSLREPELIRSMSENVEPLTLTLVGIGDIALVALQLISYGLPLIYLSNDINFLLRSSSFSTQNLRLEQSTGEMLKQHLRTDVRDRRERQLLQATRTETETEFSFSSGIQLPVMIQCEIANARSASASSRTDRGSALSFK